MQSIDKISQDFPNPESENVVAFERSFGQFTFTTSKLTTPCPVVNHAAYKAHRLNFLKYWKDFARI